MSTISPDIGFYTDYLNNANGPVCNPIYGVQVCFAQNAILNRVDTRIALNVASNTYVFTPVSQGLDTGFPYRIAYQIDNNDNVVLDNNKRYVVLMPPQWSISGSGPTLGAGGDSPFQRCEPSLVNGDPGGIDWRSSTANDQFDTWTMYRPPEVGNYPTVWVPVQTIHWAWSGSASVHTDANGNVGLDNQGNPQWYFAPPKADPAGNPSNTVLFPTWTTVILYLPAMGPPPNH